MIALAEVLRRSTQYLEDRGSPTARLDAELLLAHGLGVSRIELRRAQEIMNAGR